MRALLLTYGTRGDVEPFLALALGLRARGHEVALATSPRFRAFIEARATTFLALDDALLSIIDGADGKALMEDLGFFGLLRRGVASFRRTTLAQAALWRDCRRVADIFRPDVVVFHPKCVAGAAIAEKRGVPCAIGSPIPLFLPTAAFPFCVFPDAPFLPGVLRAAYRRATHRLVAFLAAKGLAGAARAHREALGLAPTRRFDPLRAADGAPIPILHAYSPTIVPRPADWPDAARVTGYWRPPADESWRPSLALNAFLEAGPPPVYVGFGSIKARDPERLGALAVGALRKIGARGVIATGWGAIRVEDPGADMLVIDGAPHDWLFPQMAAIVHHGGAGVAAAALIAGKPQVVVPFSVDQPFWARTVHGLGVAPPPLPRRRLEAERLAAALDLALRSQTMATRAAALSAALAAEDGVAVAVDAIEALERAAKG